MTTSARSAFVSITATMAITLALVACVGASARPAPNTGISTDALPLTIRFDNIGRERADVYLIGVKRAWVLGRLEPGAIASLRIPDEAMAKGSRYVRHRGIAAWPP